jgi:hypothetical protein
VPIAFGFPTAEAWEASERGESRIGGCVVGEGRPTIACATCSLPL